METEQLNACIFQWKIENISHYLFNPGGQLKSPTFIARLPKRRKFSLNFLSYHFFDPKRFYVSIQRELTGSEADVIEVNYYLAILMKHSVVFREQTERQCKFSKNVARGFGFLEATELSDVERECFYPDDILTVECTLWNQGEMPVNLKKMYSRTVLKVSRRSFIWRIPKFSTRTTNPTDMFRDALMQFDITLNVGLNLERKITINFFDENIERFSLKTSFIDCTGEKEDCDIHNYLRNELDARILILSPTLLTQTLMLNENRFLHDDILTLKFECIFLTSYNLIEFFKCTGMISKKLMNECVENKNTDDVIKPLSISVINDFQAMYNEAILSDISLRTSTKTFPAHKNILSARSPVFRRMFSHDMKEKNSGQVDITDFQDNTIHQMLLYMYTDKLEDLDFERASKLYAAADKYEILSLKNRCSSFLKENVRPTNACEVLVLADLHNDDDLKISIQGYILENHKQVFWLQEWQLFMDTHLKLAADVMYQKCSQE